jgi:low temperature requirement protein LtrA
MARSRLHSPTAIVVVIAAVMVASALWWLYATFQRDRTNDIENYG